MTELIPIIGLALMASMAETILPPLPNAFIYDQPMSGYSVLMSTNLTDWKVAEQGVDFGTEDIGENGEWTLVSYPNIYPTAFFRVMGSTNITQ